MKQGGPLKRDGAPSVNFLFMPFQDREFERGDAPRLEHVGHSSLQLAVLMSIPLNLVM